MSALPQNPTVLGCGAVTVDFLAAVEAYPKPDEKIRSTSLKIQGGGNAGNALTCAARLGLNPRLISKVADDAQGRGILEELEADGIDTSFLVAMWNFASHPPSCTACSLDSTCRAQARDTYPTHHWYPALMSCYTVFGRTQPQKLAHEVRVPSRLYISYYWYSSDVGLHFSATSAMVSKEGNSPFTYVIVDNQTKTRTCIHTPGFPPMIPDYLSKSSLSSALDGVRLVYFDGRLHETALVVGHEAKSRSIPILIDAEKKREGLDDLLNLSDYVVCSAKFPQAWTEASSIPSALLSILLRLPNVKFVIVTLGGDGCIMLQRSATEGEQSEEIDIDCLLESLNQRKGSSNTAIPTCISSVIPFFQEGNLISCLYTST